MDVVNKIEVGDKIISIKRAASKVVDGED